MHYRCVAVPVPVNLQSAADAVCLFVHYLFIVTSAQLRRLSTGYHACCKYSVSWDVLGHVPAVTHSGMHQHSTRTWLGQHLTDCKQQATSQALLDLAQYVM
jgi:hypothetical protein